MLLPSTVVGLEAWNAARRPSTSLVKRAFNRAPMHVVTPASPGHSSNASDVDLALEVDRERSSGEGHAAQGHGQGGFGGWLGGGRRSRSGTTVTAVVLAPGERTEQQRRAAGAGNGLLGTGLLRCVSSPSFFPLARRRPALGEGEVLTRPCQPARSAPPNYDPRALAGYVEDNPNLRLSTRADYDDPEADSLPDYS